MGYFYASLLSIFKCSLRFYELVEFVGVGKTPTLRYVRINHQGIRTRLTTRIFLFFYKKYCTFLQGFFPVFHNFPRQSQLVTALHNAGLGNTDTCWSRSSLKRPIWLAISSNSPSGPKKYTLAQVTLGSLLFRATPISVSA